ncbi:hypothetical protein [Rhodovarius crocodyli]|uniref:hypothetical protein n=1 Tax=Rhodovarius crocodyli TaxID=1979269 RepID=UPI0013E28D4B|nr:hypothetical protein [Rhodovarius crocodyli]
MTTAPSLWARLRARFAWREMGRSTRHIYQQNAVTGARRFIFRDGGGYVPLDQAWLDGKHDKLFQTPMSEQQRVVAGLGATSVRGPRLASSPPAASPRIAAAPSGGPGHRREDYTTLHMPTPLFLDSHTPSATPASSTPSSSGGGNESSNNSYSSGASDVGGGGGGGDPGGGGGGE